MRVDPGALPPDGPPLVTGKQLAANLGVSGKTIGRLVRSGQIPAVKIGDLWRFDVGVVRRALDKKTRK